MQCDTFIDACKSWTHSLHHNDAWEIVWCWRIKDSSTVFNFQHFLLKIKASYWSDLDFSTDSIIHVFAFVSLTNKTPVTSQQILSHQANLRVLKNPGQPVTVQYDTRALADRNIDSMKPQLIFAITETVKHIILEFLEQKE